MTTALIMKILNEEYGIIAHRTTIPKDIATLHEFCVDIMVVHSTHSKFFVVGRKFELQELN